MAKRLFNIFFEEVKPKPQMDVSSYTEYEPIHLDDFDMLDVAVPTSQMENIVDETYNENGLADRNRSVYMVEVYMETLPLETPSEVKSMTVRKILNASGISEDEIVTDAENRKSMLEAVRCKVSDKNDEMIAEANAQIEALKEQIAELNKVIHDAKNEKTEASAVILDEIEKIQSLEEFIKLSGGNE